MAASRTKLYLLYVMIAGVIVGCGVNLFSISDDANLGLQMDQEIRNNPSEYPILRNEEVRGYLQNMVNRIVASPQVKYRGTFPYKVTVINDNRTINAFCTPGGYIYVYTGLLKFVDNEATLAGVLGHEIAHAEERHGTEHMTQALGLEVVLSIALGNNPSQLAQVAGNAAALVAMMKNSQSDELEADTRSFGYLQSTTYWPGSIKLFFEKMERASTGGSGVLDSWLSTHPSGAERVANINRLLQESGTPAATPATLHADAYKKFLRMLK